MLITPDTARRLLGGLERPSARHEVDLQDLVAELEHVAAQASGTLYDAKLGVTRGPDPSGRPAGGVTVFAPDYRTVITDSLGAVAMITAPRNELAIYLELGGRLNKRQERDEAGYLLAVGRAAELMASLVVAGQAGGREFSGELEAAIAREQARRGLERRS
jgi:hypothetical protein